MKKIIIIISTILALASCDYLDIVPTDAPTLDDAYKDEHVAARTLYACYTYIPEFNHARNNPFRLTTPETVGGYHWGEDYFTNIGVQRGMISSTSGRTLNQWEDAYRGIRNCYTFLDYLDNDKIPNTKTKPSDFEKLKKDWRGQLYYLIGYYHFLLMQLYGPVPIIDELYDISSTGEASYRARLPYDDCVDAVVGFFDKAYEYLPDVLLQADYGRPTKSAALAMKSKLLLYAASPLFNGNNRLYANFKDHSGQHLISQTYDKEKWKKALDAAEAAIIRAEGEGKRTLYYGKKDADITDFANAVNTARLVITDPWGEELIWGYTGKPEPQSGYGLQHLCIPRGFGSKQQIGSQGVSLYAVEMFLTKNGLPMDKDPEYDYNNRMSIKSGDETIYLHRDREPRFEAWIGFDRGYYPVNGLTQLRLRAGESAGAPVSGGSVLQNQDHFYSGYALAKGINPGAKVSSTQFSIIKYPMPIARLAEMYFNYVEAYVEYYGKLDGKALTYINAIRQRAGLPNFEDSYSKIGIPTGEDLINTVRQERTIEFLFEGHMYTDYRRWMIASKEWKDFRTGMWGLNSAGQTAETFYRKTRLLKQYYIFSSKYYLAPIVQGILNKNRALVQNPGWGADIVPEI